MITRIINWPDLTDYGDINFTISLKNTCKVKKSNNNYQKNDRLKIKHMQLRGKESNILSIEKVRRIPHVPVRG